MSRRGQGSRSHSERSCDGVRRRSDSGANLHRDCPADWCRCEHHSLKTEEEEEEEEPPRRRRRGSTEETVC